MQASRTPTGRGATVVGVALLLSLACSASGLSEVEMTCEEAAAQLDECCEDVEATTFACRAPDGCGFEGIVDLPLDVSRCLRDKSCAELEAEGHCEDARTKGNRLQCR